MAGQILPYAVTFTPVGGTKSLNTTGANGFQSWQYGGLIRFIFLESTTPGTMFDFKITSEDSNVIYEKKNITSVWRSGAMAFPVRGTCTITIENVVIPGDPETQDPVKLEIGFEVGREGS